MMNRARVGARFAGWILVLIAIAAPESVAQSGDVTPEKVVNALEGAFGVLHALHLVQELGLAPPGLRIGGVGGDHLVQSAQGGIVLAVRIELERLLQLGMDGLTAPFEFLATATRASCVKVECHAPHRG